MSAARRVRCTCGPLKRTLSGQGTCLEYDPACPEHGAGSPVAVRRSEWDAFVRDVKVPPSSAEAAARLHDACLALIGNAHSEVAP